MDALVKLEIGTIVVKFDSNIMVEPGHKTSGWCSIYLDRFNYQYNRIFAPYATADEALDAALEYTCC